MTEHATYQAGAARQLNLERRRTRGEISCAECRRLKVKCDKKIPCSSCKRRGCPTICPNGTLSGGQGTRFVLADTQKLHRKLAEMSERIRQLEDGLQISHSSQSSMPHALLSDELLGIKHGVDGSRTLEEEEDEDDGLLPLEAFGTLRIGEGGAARFLGPSAASEGLLLSELEEKENAAPTQLNDDLAASSQAWPFLALSISKEDSLALIQEQLPSFERASSLCEAYLQNICWFCAIVDRSQIMEELIPRFYKRNPQTTKSQMDPHELALLLLVFASGAAGDLTQSPNNQELNFYQELARAALGQLPVFSSVSLATVQAVSMLGNLNIYSQHQNSLEEGWKILNFALSLAKSIGLHRDPARWNLDNETAQRRRRVFWEMYSIDNWMSLASGRPATFTALAHDVALPSNDEASFQHWRFTFVKKALVPVTDRLSTCTTPLKYAEILNLDRIIRELQGQEAFERYDQLIALDQCQHLEKLHVLGCKHIGLLYLHRNYFAKAIMDNPMDPLRSPFAPSFLSAYRSATSLLQMIHRTFKDVGDLKLRVWPLWAHILASGVVVGSVVTRCPTLELAEPAFKELELAIETLKMGTSHPITVKGLPILLRIREKAQQLLREARTDPARVSARSNTISLDRSNEHDELSILGGTSRLLSGPKSSAIHSKTLVANRSNDMASLEVTPLDDPTPLPSYLPEPTVQYSSQQPMEQVSDQLSQIGPIHPEIYNWLSHLDPVSQASLTQSWLTESSSTTSMLLDEMDLAKASSMLEAGTFATNTPSHPSPPWLGNLQSSELQPQDLSPSYPSDLSGEQVYRHPGTLWM